MRVVTVAKLGRMPVALFVDRSVSTHRAGYYKCCRQICGGKLERAVVLV